MNGTFDFRVARCATNPRSSTSCTEADARRANPVWRVAMTSEWSPKMERACPARARAETWKTVGKSSPAILYMFGIINRSPCEAVNVVVNAPAASDPCTAPAAPDSACISVTCSGWPKMFFLP